MRRYKQNRDGEWRTNQVMTNEKKFSSFLLEIEYYAATYARFVEDPTKAIWFLNITTNHCPTCEHQLEEGDKRGTVELVNADTEHREVIKFLKKYFKGTYDDWEDFPKHLRNFELRKSEGSDVRSLKIFSKHYHYDCNHVTMEFENKKELEDFLNFLVSELNEAEIIQKEEYVRCKEWHDDIEKRRSQKA